MSKLYFIGVDVGQVQDYTAIAVVEALPVKGEDLRLRCHYLQTMPLGLQFRDIARRLSEIEAKLKARGEAAVTILVDATGPGQPVPELIRGLVKCDVISCRFTSGAEPAYEGSYWKLPKPAVVTRLKIFLQEKRLELPGKTKDQTQARVINEMLLELQNFQYNQPEEGARAETFEAKVGSHDDMVTALGLAVWGAKRADPGAGGSAEAVGRTWAFSGGPETVIRGKDYDYPVDPEDQADLEEDGEGGTLESARIP